MLRVLDLFSGIGGFSLGLERTGGFRTVAFCEIEPYCRAVLKKYWPEVPCFEDVRLLRGSDLADGVDVVCGGFPCQDISVAGKGAGIDGSSSGLWGEYARIVSELRPRYVIVENVAALLVRGLDRVLGDLSKIGYDTEWHCIPASHVGAPHLRDRLWLVAYPASADAWSHAEQSEGKESDDRQPAQFLPDASGSSGGAETWTDSEAKMAHSDSKPKRRPAFKADASGDRGAPRMGTQVSSGRCSLRETAPALANTNRQPTRRLAIAWGECDQWLVEPDVGRVANGVPSRVDRLRALGNSVVPQIPEIIGRAILEAEGLKRSEPREERGK